RTSGRTCAESWTPTLRNASSGAAMPLARPRCTPTPRPSRSCETIPTSTTPRRRWFSAPPRGASSGGRGRERTRTARRWTLPDGGRDGIVQRAPGGVPRGVSPAWPAALADLAADLERACADSLGGARVARIRPASGHSGFTYVLELDRDPGLAVVRVPPPGAR